MASWIVVPVKPPGAGKTRLAGVLDDAARRDLVARMLYRVVDAAGGVADARVALLGPSRHGLDAALRRIDEPGGGLNAALAATLGIALTECVDRLVLVSGDLPCVTAADIAALVRLAPDTIGIAPDRAGRGTNALSLPLPHAGGFGFRYGADSFARHGEAARRIGLPVAVVRRDGLAFDVDLPEDLAALRRA